MPKWGLTPEMRRSGPWGIDADLLLPGKQITDPVHGDIYVNRLETILIDSPPLQRLRRVRQLGATHLVYPGATHSRFSHVLGSLRVAQDLLDVVLDQRSAANPVPDWFEEWEREGTAHYSQKVAEATVLARLGALLHDVCHVPFGHSIEDDLGILVAHDENEKRFDDLWNQMDIAARGAISGDLMDNLKPLVLSQLRDRDGYPERYPFVFDIVGNTICADLLDYLRRDHLYTGLPLALGRRFEAGFYVTPSGDPELEHKMTLRITRPTGRERTDAITELLKHLRYRYELSERALVHHTKLAADAMVGKALEMWLDAARVEHARVKLVAGGYRSAAKQSDQPAPLLEDLGRRRGLRSVAAVRKTTRDMLERELQRHGDDSLLEYLRDIPKSKVSASRRVNPGLADLDRLKAVAALADDLLNRRLYKQVAHAKRVKGSKQAFYDRFGSPEARRDLERAAARFAGVRPAWKILIWLPEPKMRLKVAEVLVDDGSEIDQFVAWERHRGGRGDDIYKAHEDLWGVSIYVHPSVIGEDKADAVLVELARLMNAQLGPLTAQLGNRPYEWPDRYAAKRVAEERGNGMHIDRLIRMRRQRELATRRRRDAPPPTLRALIRTYEQIADA